MRPLFVAAAAGGAPPGKAIPRAAPRAQTSIPVILCFIELSSPLHRLHVEGEGEGWVRRARMAGRHPALGQPALMTNSILFAAHSIIPPSSGLRDSSGSEGKIGASPKRRVMALGRGRWWPMARHNGP